MTRLTIPVEWYRDYIIGLHNRGVTWSYMKRTTGLSYATLNSIRAGTQERIHQKTADKIFKLAGPE